MIKQFFAAVADLEREAAGLVRATLREAVAVRGAGYVALAGGRTPRRVYEAVAAADAADAAQLDWSAIHVCLGDERHVPPDHADSNARMAREALLDRVPIPGDHVHRPPTELADAQAAAAAYDAALRSLFRGHPRGEPVFDLVLLGMGADGHTASLFPDTPVLDERDRFAAAVWVESLQAWRVTLTLPVINRARRVLVLVTGREKGPTLDAVWHGPTDVTRYPIQAVKPVDGQLVWFVADVGDRIGRPAAP